jgi:hypothetical protein
MSPKAKRGVLTGPEIDEPARDEDAFDTVALWCGASFGFFLYKFQE